MGWVILIAVALAVVCLCCAFRSLRSARLLADMPTSKTTGVFLGLVELKGTAECESPLQSALALLPCVHFDWSVEEHWQRAVTEHYTDNTGKGQTRTRIESGWTCVNGGGESKPFYLKDDCGALLVSPQGADVEPVEVFSSTCTPDDDLYYLHGPQTAVAHSTHERRLTERAIELHAKLYVVGRARERQDVVAAEIAAGTDGEMFLISTRSEEAVRASLGWHYVAWLVGGALLLGAGLLLRDEELHLRPGDHPLWYAGAAGAYIAAAAIGWVWTVFNSLVALRQNVRRGWASIEVQLQRRSDLIPRLVEMVKGLRDHEQRVQVEVASLRSQAVAGSPGGVGATVRGCLGALAVIVEKYPDLKAQEGFLQLQGELAGTEQRIALARDYYNHIATFYNTRLEVVPDRFVAGLGGMRPQSLLVTADIERAPVSVSFAA